VTARSADTLTMAAGRHRAAEELTPGIRVGRYVIQGATARGGFATIYRARAAVTGEDVALKVLHPEVALSSVAVRRLQQEAEVLRRVAHPNIVQTFEVDEIAPEQPYLVMEWLEGHTLGQELMRRATFSPTELLGVLEQLCAGLGAAHEAGIVHRDLKASNVMVLPEDAWFTLKLVDFGIAKLLAGEPTAARHSLTMSGVTLGTPHYMAPEQVLGHEVDARTDIYALGVLSYLLLTGRLPFHALDAAAIQEMHLYCAPPRVGDLVPVPTGVDDILQRCLQKRRDQRPASVRDLLDALRMALRRPDAAAGAPGQVARGGPREVVGLYVAVYARGACERAGLSIAFEGSNAFLAARSAEEDDAARERLVDLALALRDRWVGRHPGVRVSFALHAEPARPGNGDPPPPDHGDATPTGRPAPFQPGGWTSGLVQDAVIASRDALTGVAHRFELAEATDIARFRILGRRGSAGAAEGSDGA
jgi:eukaryotic-like serine/threonine-protein kinase